MKSFKTYMLDEDLRKWFGKGKEGDWVRVGTDGEIKGQCAREPGEGKPKCMPRSRAHGMDKDDRAKSAKRKRRKDPVADRKGKGGKPIMVNTEEKTLEEKKRGLWDNIRAKRARGEKPAKKGSKDYPDELEKIREEELHKKNVPTKADLYKAYSQGMKMTSGTAAHKAHLEKIKKMRKDLGMNEENLHEKNVPTKPALWSKYKAQAKAKFDVYPSAYANGWAAKMYKKAGGGWKSVSESLESSIAEACWSGYKKKGMKKKGNKVVPNCVPEGKEHSWKSEGHYTKDGKEWKGDQHAHNGQVMTGKKHTADSQDLYHYKELSPEVRKKVAKTIEEKLSADKDSIGTYVKDFKKSDAPQFKGKSSSKRRSMAIAAYLKSKRRDGERSLGESIKYNSDMGAMDWGTPAGTDYMKDNTPGQKNPKEAPVKPLEQSTLRRLNVQDKYVKESGPAHETKAEYKKDNAEDAPELGDYALTKQDIAELEHEADNITYEKALEYGAFDDEDNEEPEVNITEVLSVQGRLKRKFAARKNKQKLKVARGIALRRGSSPDRLKKRATRGARGAVYKRLLKGRDKSKLPPAEKGRLEKLIGMYAPLVSRLATRMLPGMRKMEISRMKNRKGGAQKAKKYKAAKPVAKTQKAKKYKIKR